MSKPDPAATKSLEEILASIRKSLADEPSAPTPEPSAAPVPVVETAQPEPKPVTPVANGADLAGKLAAGLLNGVSRPSVPDDDLSELLAGEPTKPVPSAPLDAPKPPQAKSDARDPLWFLSRLSSAAADALSPGSAARDAAKAPAARGEEPKLSRPETLRPSLPPLFGSGSEPIPPATAREDIKDISLTARTEPRGAPRQVNGEATTANVKPEVAATTPAPKPVVQAAPPPALQALPVEADTVPKEALPPTPAAALETAPTVAVVTPQPPTKVEPVIPVAPVRAAPAPEKALPVAESATAPSPQPADAPPTRGFEQAVGELLEPVIRQWLHNNLPRMIEKAVREEVVRALAAERDAAKR